MRLIDGNKLLNLAKSERDTCGKDYDFDGLLSDIENASTVDAVPVTRCKDCKWYDAELHCKLNGYGCGRSPDWFCADGKKEEE